MLIQSKSDPECFSWHQGGLTNTHHVRNASSAHTDTKRKTEIQTNYLPSSNVGKI